MLTHELPSIFDIPRLISPNWAGKNDTFSIQYPGIDIRFERGFLYNSSPVGKDAGYAPGYGKDYMGIDSSSDDSDDEDYVSESEASLSYLSDAASVASSCLDDEMYLPEFSDSDASAMD
jgi:hypothetical protein